MTTTVRIQATKDCILDAADLYPFYMKEDDVAEVDPRFLASAVSQGCVQLGAEAAAAEPEGPSAEERSAAILETVKQLIVDGVASNFTSGNRPKTAVVSKILGYKVNADEVNAAVESILSEPSAD